MALTDSLWGFRKDFLGSATKYVAITPSDTVDFDLCRAVYVGVGGDIVFVDADGDAVTHKNAAAGSTLTVRAKRVNATGTTATDLVAWY